ncbi:conserved hypothetical protein, partial [Perkinsus marinus ATCC 50983]
MAVDSHALIERGWGPETPANYTKKDVILYALGVGASELRYVYENNDEFACLPSMPFALTFKGGNSADVLPFPPQHFMGAMGQIPPRGEFTADASSAVPHQRTGLGRRKIDEVIQVIANFGRELGDEEQGHSNLTETLGITDLKSAGEPSKVVVDVPQRPPDREVSEMITLGRVQTYRLSGDYNPLHIDDDVAKVFGFPRAIVHGLCTLGHSVRHVIKEFSDSGPGA